LSYEPNAGAEDPDASGASVLRRAARWAAAVCAMGWVACGPGVPGDVIGRTSSFADGLTQDADFLYWHTQDALMRLSKQGGSPETILDGRSPAALTVSGDRVFWLNDDGANVSLRSAANTGGDERVLDPDENDGRRILRNLATDGTFLYWSNEVGQLRRAPVAGGDAINLGILDTSASSVAAIGGGVFATTLRSIFRFQQPGDPPRQMIPTRFDIPEFVTPATPPDSFFYWVERGSGAQDGRVYRAAEGGGDPAQLSRGEVAPGPPSSDGRHVYFATGAQDDRIRRARVTGSPDAEDFAEGQVGDPVVDGSDVFWIDREGRVHKASSSK
jgi:hypothetical protein